jgi:chromosomal replication initiator protein
MPARRVEPDHEVWSALLKHLRAHRPELCRQWFEEIEPSGLGSGVLRLRAHSNIHRDYLQKQCVGPFQEAAQTVTGRLLALKFLGPDDEAGEVPVASKPAASATTSEPAAPAASAPTERDDPTVTPTHLPESQRRPVQVHVESNLEHLYDDGLVLNPDYGFEHFVVGPGNRLAHAAAQAVASNPGRAYNPFFVHGDVGLGKTHLLQAICLRIHQANPNAVIYYTSCEGFMTQFMDAVAAGLMTRFRYKFRHVDVLVIDDIHFLAKRDRTQEEFFHTFNSLYQSHKQIVLSSDAPPEEIPDLEDRLVSRFKWGLVTSLVPPCYETRVEILKQKARLRGFDLPADVAGYVAGKIDSNIRELEGAVIKLQVMSTVEKRPVDMDLARAALNDNEPRGETRIQIQTIINAVTDFYGVKVTDLQSKRRQRSIALPRQLCMYLARRHTRYSLEEIGGYFGGRDHTTVMHAVRTIEDRATGDGEFGATVKSIEDKLRQPN